MLCLRARLLVFRLDSDLTEPEFNEKTLFSVKGACIPQVYGTPGQEDDIVAKQTG